jgi:hypothetical protein
MARENHGLLQKPAAALEKVEAVVCDKVLTQAGAAVHREREEDGEQCGEQNSPPDAAGPYAKDRDEALVDLVLIG